MVVTEVIVTILRRGGERRERQRELRRDWLDGSDWMAFWELRAHIMIISIITCNSVLLLTDEFWH